MTDKGVIKGAEEQKNPVLSVDECVKALVFWKSHFSPRFSEVSATLEAKNVCPLIPWPDPVFGGSPLWDVTRGNDASNNLGAAYFFRFKGRWQNIVGNQRGFSCHVTFFHILPSANKFFRFSSFLKFFPCLRM